MLTSSGGEDGTKELEDELCTNIGK